MAIDRIEIGTRMSQAAGNGHMVYLAGQVASDSSQPVAGQAQQILDRIDELLGKAGSDKSRILYTQIWLADMADYSAFNQVWDAWIDPENPPARACVESKLASPDWKVELQVVAVK